MNNVPEMKTFLYASDLGDHMRPVFRHAIGLAERHQGQIVMLHVAEELTSTGQAIVEAYLPEAQREVFHQEAMQQIMDSMRERIKAFCEEEIGECPDESSLVSDVLVTYGHPADEIRRQAEVRSADLIVMGTGSHGFLGHGLLGSTARRVIHGSKIPVMVVPNCHK